MMSGQEEEMPGKEAVDPQGVGAAEINDGDLKKYVASKSKSSSS